ncbi:MAG: hypothetical protein JNL98_24330 [Bryobacterales bacterium]|nr:hypothetical protein [Bryobacterales bacterium]
MKTAGLAVLVIAYWAMHQDIWFWRDARPLAFGFLPVGLTYHAVYTLGIALLMYLLVKVAWPAELEREVDRSDD